LALSLRPCTPIALGTLAALKPRTPWRASSLQSRSGGPDLQCPVSAATAAGSDGAKTANGLLTRALGPTADAIGQDLAARYSEYRQRNTGRIIGRAEKKARESGRSGSVHPRVAHRVIEEGSFGDDAVIADYLGGLLAGGRTPNGRDDRAIVWSNLVTALSAAVYASRSVTYCDARPFLRAA